MDTAAMAPIIAVWKPVIILGIILLCVKFGAELLVAHIKKSPRRKQKRAPDPTYERQEYLLTPAELKFHSALKAAVGDIGPGESATNTGLSTRQRVTRS